MYVDVNASDPSGAPIEGIFADYVLEVKGVAGRVTSRTLSAWSNGWTAVPGSPVPVAKDASAIEGAIPIPPTSSDLRFVFAMTDWSGAGDVTRPLTALAVPPPAPPQPVSPIEVHAPEFEWIAAPLLGTLLLGLAASRRRRRTA